MPLFSRVQIALCAPIIATTGVSNSKVNKKPESRKGFRVVRSRRPGKVRQLASHGRRFCNIDQRFAARGDLERLTRLQGLDDLAPRTQDLARCFLHVRHISTKSTPANKKAALAGGLKRNKD